MGGRLWTAKEELYIQHPHFLPHRETLSENSQVHTRKQHSDI